MRPKLFIAFLAVVVLLVGLIWARAQPTNIPTASTVSLALSTNGVLQGVSTNLFSTNIALLTNALAAVGYPAGGGVTGAVVSVFGRDGIVSAALGDYDAALVGVAFSPTNSTAGATNVDRNLRGIDVALGLRVLKAGDTMTGALSNQVHVGAPLLIVGSTNIADAIAGKAALSHTHSTNDITGLVAELAARLTEIAASALYQGTNVHLTDLADGTLTGSKVGTGIDDDNVSFDDADSLWTATAIGPALEELNDSINAGVPNGSGAKVHWSQLLGVPAGFADGSDDGSGGGAPANTVVGPGVAVTDHSVTRWHGTTGTNVQGSVVIIDDAGAMSGVTEITVAGSGANQLGGTNNLDTLYVTNSATLNGPIIVPPNTISPDSSTNFVINANEAVYYHAMTNNVNLIHATNFTAAGMESQLILVNNSGSHFGLSWPAYTAGWWGANGMGTSMTVSNGTSAIIAVKSYAAGNTNIIVRAN